MKKYLVMVLISLLLTLGGMLVNYYYFQHNGWLLWSLKTYGGEITGELGFGWQVSHTYGMMPGQHDMVSIRFSLLSFLLTFLILFAAVLLIFFIYRKVRTR